MIFRAGAGVKRVPSILDSTFRNSGAATLHRLSNPTWIRWQDGCTARFDGKHGNRKYISGGTTNYFNKCDHSTTFPVCRFLSKSYRCRVESIFSNRTATRQLLCVVNWVKSGVKASNHILFHHCPAISSILYRHSFPTRQIGRLAQ